MKKKIFNTNYCLVTICIIAVIVHGSLYPYEFGKPHGLQSALSALLSTWNEHSSFGDMAANILLYMPFGFFAVLALREWRWRFLVVTIAGLCICTSIELAQYFDASRVTAMSDVYSNTLGTIIGAFGGVVLRHRSLPVFLRKPSESLIPLLLIVAMLGYHLYPYVPTVDLHKYWDSLKPIVLHPDFSAYQTFHYFAVWITVDFLIFEVMEVRYRKQALILFLAFVFFAKVVITSLVVTTSELTGAAIATAISLLVLNDTRFAARMIGVLLCVTIVALRLEPFHFLPYSRGFSWIPFRSEMQGSLKIDAISFFEKFFLYGSLIWIAKRSGLSMLAATIVVVGILFCTSWAEIYLPGRSAEITDALTALIVGVIFMMLSEKRDPNTDFDDKRQFPPIGSNPI